MDPGVVGVRLGTILQAQGLGKAGKSADHWPCSSHTLGNQNPEPWPLSQPLILSPLPSVSASLEWGRDHSPGLDSVV